MDVQLYQTYAGVNNLRYPDGAWYAKPRLEIIIGVVERNQSTLLPPYSERDIKLFAFAFAFDAKDKPAALQLFYETLATNYKKPDFEKWWKEAAINERQWEADDHGARFHRARRFGYEQSLKWLFGTTKTHPSTAFDMSPHMRRYADVLTKIALRRNSSTDQPSTATEVDAYTFIDLMALGYLLESNYYNDAKQLYQLYGENSLKRQLEPHFGSFDGLVKATATTAV